MYYYSTISKDIVELGIMGKEAIGMRTTSRAKKEMMKKVDIIS